MEVKAHLKHFRMSPRKVRLVLGLIRGMKVEYAREQLGVLNKKASVAVMKLLNSAVANAEHNFDLPSENLFVKSVFADGGRTLKRWRPRAFGRAAMIRKRTSHVTIILDARAEKPVHNQNPVKKVKKMFESKKKVTPKPQKST
jgi:large subunit ribosomal protein L22